MWEKGVKGFSMMDADVENEEVGAGVFSGMEWWMCRGRIGRIRMG